MATKVEKRKVRQQKNAEALGIELPAEEKKSENGKKKSSNKMQWILFFIDMLLLMICLSYYHATH